MRHYGLAHKDMVSVCEQIKSEHEGHQENDLHLVWSERLTESLTLKFVAG